MKIYALTFPVCMMLLPLVSSAQSEEQPVNREAHTAEDQYRFAEGLHVRKFYEMAEQEFRHFLNQYPDHELAPNAMFRLIEALRQQDQNQETLSVINQFHAKWPSHELASKLYLWKGELLLKDKKLAQAASCFKRLLLSADAVVQEAAIYFLGQCYAEQGKHDLALETYRKIASKDFDEEHLYRPYALFTLAMDAQQKGDLDAAARDFQLLKDKKHVPAAVREEAIYRLAEIHFLRQQMKDAVVLYELLLVDYPTGFFAREAGKRRMWAYFIMGQYAKSIELAKEWRKQFGDVFDYEVDYIHGASLVAANFFSEAVEILSKLRHDDRIPEEYFKLSLYQELYALLRLEKYDDLLALADLFVKKFPKTAQTADVYYFAGEAYFQKQNLEQAATRLRQAVDSFLDDSNYYEEAHLRLTECLEELKRNTEAAAIYRKLSQDPKMQDQAFALLQAGLNERKAGDVKAAVTDFEKLLTNFADAGTETRTAMLHLGELYAEQNQFDRAVELLQKLLSETKGDGRASLLFFLGYLYFQQEQYDKAAEVLRQSLQQKASAKTASSARYFLGGALLEMQKNDEALELFAELLALPEEQRPAFDENLLFRLESLFYNRNRYDTSEIICRWLLKWDDPDVRYRATLRLAQILMAQNKFNEAQTKLNNLLDKLPENDENSALRRQEVKSVLGEVLLNSKDFDRAVTAFEQSLSRPGLAGEFVARSRWGLAHILYHEERYNQALHYAINGFVLTDDPRYTSRAMFLAIQILLKQDKANEALTTWRELRNRYPSFAEQKRQTAEIEKLLTLENQEQAKSQN